MNNANCTFSVINKSCSSIYKSFVLNVVIYKYLKLIYEYKKVQLLILQMEYKYLKILNSF